MFLICAAMACLALAFFARDALRDLLRRTLRGTPRRAARPEAPPAISAQELLAECTRLAGVDASWPDVGAAVNPDADPHVDALLHRIRAVHMGAVPETLRAIAQGCRIALAENADASGFDALSEAARRGQFATTAKL